MFSKKKKIYYISYELNKEEKSFQIALQEKEGRKYCITFYQDRMVETGKEQLVRFFLYKRLPNFYQMQVKNKKFPEAMQYALHEVFPYITKCENFAEFSQLYTTYNKRFSYADFAEIREMCQTIRESNLYPAEGRWFCVYLKSGVYLACKWMDEADVIHALVMNDCIYESDLKYEEILEQESLRKSESVRAFELFDACYSNTCLHQYVKNGGEKIYSFLLSRQTNHPQELLGKAGLALLSDNIDMFEGIQTQGNNFEEIFGLPVKVLKALNAGDDSMAYAAEDRELLYRAYKESPEIFQKPMTVLSSIWIRFHYLNGGTLLSVDGSLEHGKIGKTIQYLEKIGEKEANKFTVFCLYQRYLVYSQRLGRYLHGMYPKDLDAATDEAAELLEQQYMEDANSRYQRAIQEPVYQALQEDLPGYRYRVVIPENQEKLCLAGRELHNCLNTYSKRIKRGLSQIVLIEEKEKQRLVGAIEVAKGKVVQAKGPCNMQMCFEAELYVKGYLKRKGIK